MNNESLGSVIIVVEDGFVPGHGLGPAFEFQGHRALLVPEFGWVLAALYVPNKLAFQRILTGLVTVVVVHFHDEVVLPLDLFVVVPHQSLEHFVTVFFL